MPKNISQYLVGNEHQFPLGSIVFFYSPSSIEQYRGITHVGIVVGYKKGSPLIAHATHSNTLKQAIISRLLAQEHGDKRHYIIAKPPANRELIAKVCSLAKQLSTQNAHEKQVVPYSLERSMSMNLFTQTLFQKSARSQNPFERFSLVMKEQITQCAGLFGFNKKLKHPYWLNAFSKMLNANNLPPLPLKESQSGAPLLTKKGWHCVQFVTQVFQMAELSGSPYKNYYHQPKKNTYFSSKHGETSTQKVSPRTLERYTSSLSDFQGDYLEEALIPLSGKPLSPAALLSYLVNPPANRSKKFTIEASAPPESQTFAALTTFLKRHSLKNNDALPLNLQMKKLDSCALLLALGSIQQHCQQDLKQAISDQVKEIVASILKEKRPLFLNRKSQEQIGKKKKKKNKTRVSHFGSE